MVLPGFLISLTLAGATSCERDVVLLQHSHQISSSLKGPHELDELPDPPAEDEDEEPEDEDIGHGLCNWSSVSGPGVPPTVAGAKSLFVTTCADLYSENLCAAMTDTLFSVLQEDGEFSEEMHRHPLFCKEISELVEASGYYMQDVRSRLENRALLIKRDVALTFDKSLTRKDTITRSTKGEDAAVILVEGYSIYDDGGIQMTAVSRTAEFGFTLWRLLVLRSAGLCSALCLSAP